MTMTQQCSNCMFWAPIQNTDEGECRYGPPTPLIVPLAPEESPIQIGKRAIPSVGIRAYFPRTRPDIVCGQWQPPGGVTPN